MNSKQKSKEGGWGWVIVAAGVLVYTVVFGSLRCQSVLFLPIMDEFKANFSQVAWVSSIATGGFSIAGLLAATLIKKIGHRRTVMLGGILACTGSVLATFAPNLAVVYITAGILAGVGMGIAFVPSPVLIGHYFERRRSFATNLASIGASVGTLALCPITELLVSVYGLRGCFLIYGGIFLNLCVAGALMRGPPKPKTLENEKKALEMQEVSENRQGDELVAKEEGESSKIKVERPFVERYPLVVNIPYIIYCASQVIFLAGFICYQLYIVPFASKEIGIPPFKSALLLSIGAAIEIGSRILFGVLGDVKRIDRIWLFAIVLFALSACCAILPFMKSYAGLATVCAVSGLFQGGFGGMSVVILVDVVGLKHYGIGLGISTLLNGIGTLLAPPAVGFAANVTGKPSTALFIAAGLLFTGAFLSVMIKVALNLNPPKRQRSR